MRFEKVRDGFFVDFDEVSVVLVEEQQSFDQKLKELVSTFGVIGVTKLGQRLPFPLFEADSYADAEEFVQAYFWESKLKK